MSQSNLMCASTHNGIHDLFRGANRQLADDLIELVNRFKEYWPMTLRAFYYQAVSALLVENKQAEYRKVGKILATLRREELIPWYSMKDKTRSTSDKRGMPEVKEYIENDMETFLNPSFYQRCYIQEQAAYVELSVEKDALSTLIEDAAWMYCTRVSVTRGQVSATMLNDMAERFDKAIMQGRKPILLHFGDLDPTGIQIPKSIQSGLLEHHGLDVDVRHVGLTPEQCVTSDLPVSLQAAKVGDPNYDRWIEQYPDQAPTELDALHPEILKDLVGKNLDEVYDLSEIAEQRAKERKERELLRSMRRKTIFFLRDEFPEYMEGIGV